MWTSCRRQLRTGNAKTADRKRKCHDEITFNVGVFWETCGVCLSLSCVHVFVFHRDESLLMICDLDLGDEKISWPENLKKNN